MKENIRNFFYPKSICLFGASTKEGSIGYEILKTLQTFNYTGNVYPVNPKRDEILGYKCHHSISAVPDAIDLVIVVVPKRFVTEVIDEILEKKAKSILLITAGFKETGLEGKKLETEIFEKINSAGARMVGPNCMGIINTLPEISLNATFISEQPQVGKIAFLSQSGALGAMILNSLRETNIALSHFISVGNKADLNENDFIRFWESDDNIDVVTLYLESFENGFDFIRLFMLGEISKPTIVLKAGKTESGMKAASSHTGALSGHEKVVDALLKQFGIIRVDTTNEMFNTAKGLEYFPLPKGNRICVVTNAGGPSILLVDNIENEGLVLAELKEGTKQKLKPVIHPEGSRNNPIDLLPGGNEETFSSVIKIVLEDPNVDAVVSLFVEPVMVKPMVVAEAINEIKSDKPILQAIMPLPEFWSVYQKKSELKKPIFKNPEDPAEVLANMIYYSNTKAKQRNYKSEYKQKFESAGKGKFNFNKGFVDHSKIIQICNHYNLPRVKEILVDEKDLNNQNLIKYPLVVKGINKKVIHKSELHAVKVNIQNIKELNHAVSEISANFRSAGYEVEKYLLQEYVEVKHELLVGGYRDPSFGPIIMFGSGGKYVEVLDDTEIRSAFISEEEIYEMIYSTKVGKILSGVRGETAANIKRLKEILNSTASMLIENNKMNEVDLNPLIFDKGNCFYAVDIRIKYGK